MKHLIFAVGTFLFLASSAVAAENSYPPPPPAGKALSIEDTIYGVLRTHHSLRGMIENREVLGHEVRRAQAGFGPRVDVTGQAGGSVLSDSNTRSNNLDTQMWGKAGYSAQLVQPTGTALPPARVCVMPSLLLNPKSIVYLTRPPRFRWTQ